MTMRLVLGSAIACAVVVSGCANSGTRPPSSRSDAGAATLDGGGSDPDAGPSELCLGVDCTSLDDVCTMGACDGETGLCTSVPRPAGTVCDDADPCTLRDVCADGACAGEALDCSSTGDACNVGICDPATGSCTTMTIADGMACDDGDACTTGETCTAGTCSGAAVDCSAMTDFCNTGTCDATSGACTAVPRADGTVCNDSDACTVMDRCTAGACGGTARDCSAMSNACNVGVCDATVGGCTTMPVADGTGCDDGDVCTGPDRCTAGTCSGAPITTGMCGSVTVAFPISTDTRVASAGTYFWRLNDYVEGSRGTSLPSVRSADVNLRLELNGLTCDTQDVAFRINGITVGTFQIRGGDTTITRTFSFPAITGPTYTLRYHTTRQVFSGCGSSGYSNSGSTVTLRP